jgi:hypothetical protein
MSEALFFHIDESGNFDFSPSGSKYLIMTCVVSKMPFEHINDLYNIKCQCLIDGIDENNHKHSHRFHASEDNQNTRDAVYSIITRYAPNFSIYSVVVQKNRTNPSLRERAEIYRRVFEWLIDSAVKGELTETINSVVVVTDSSPFKKKKDDLKSAMKKYLKEVLKTQGIDYRLYQHSSESDMNLQVADYCCWAIQRKWERNDPRSYDLIKYFICDEWDIFKNGDTEYYQTK